MIQIPLFSVLNFKVVLHLIKIIISILFSVVKIFSLVYLEIWTFYLIDFNYVI